MDFLTYLTQMLNEIVADFVSNSEFTATAKLIAFIGALVATFVTFTKKVSMAGDDNEYGRWFLKILLVSLGITFYSQFLGLINAPLDLISNQAKSMAGSQEAESMNYFTDFAERGVEASPDHPLYQQRIQKYYSESTAMQEAQLNQSESDPSLFEMGNAIISSVVTNPMTKIRAYIMQGFMGVLNTLGKLALTVLNVFRAFFLIVLSIFGIFAIAFSIMPTMEGSFSTWLQKYINVYLWLPIGYILMGVINKLVRFIRVDIPMNQSELFTAGSDTQHMASTSILAALVGLCTIAGTLAIPSMAGWLVNTSTASLASKVKGKGQSNLSKGQDIAKKLAKAKATGGASIATDAAKTGAGKLTK